MRESELLPRKRCEEILLAVQAAAYRHGVADVEVSIAATDDALTRFANNEIHQNVAERSTVLSVRAVTNGRTARASTNRLHRNGIQAVVDEAVELAKASEPIPDLLPLYEDGAEVQHPDRFSDAAAGSTPASRAEGVGEAIRLVEADKLTAAGIYATAENAEALLNSRGLFRYYAETLSQFSITVMGADSSGWAKATSPIHDDVDPVRLAERAVRKAVRSRAPRELAPGRYTVILEPAAVLDLVGQIFADFSGTALTDQRSFLNERMGEKLFGPEVTIYDDAAFPLQAGAPFDGEGVPRETLTLVKAGVPRQVAHSRGSAKRSGTEPTGHGFPLPNDIGEAPVNIVIAGGQTCLDDMIASTKDGILVTRLWYIREVEPYDKVMTGMTRDGTFLIRGGEIAGGLRNFRFNQSVVELLRNVETLSSSVRASGEEAFDMVVPAMKVRDFHFTEVTRF
jgi:predicted Zn-dependent protease